MTGKEDKQLSTLPTKETTQLETKEIQQKTHTHTHTHTHTQINIQIRTRL